MYSTESEKERQLKTILYTLKLLALFFSAVPIFQTIFSGEDIGTLFDNNRIIAAIISVGILFVILIVLIVVLFYMDKKQKMAFYIELVVYFSIFLAAIMFSGMEKSYYKFLFIFIIICYAIEYSMKAGLAVAAVSSAVLLIIDLISYNKSGVNIYFENDLALMVMFLSIAFTVGLYARMNKQHIDYLRHYANLDGLTMIYNHRYFHQRLQEECAKSEKENKPVSILMADIDYFKNYNDAYGHQQGDEIIKKVVEVIEKTIKSKDILCRYGGEEFAVIMPNTNIEQGVICAEKIRKNIAESEFEGENIFPEKKLTVSVGVAQLGKDNHDFKELIKSADSALYRAKYLRKNRVEIYSSIIDKYDTNSKNREQLQSLKTLISIINSRDSYTYNHIERVVGYCDVFSNYLKLDKNKKMVLIYAAYLHDLGKINVSKETLISSSELNETQWEELKRHPKDGADMLETIDGFENIAKIILQHHERFDGKGYPEGLKGEQIEYLARILTIADSFDAMTNNRPYKKKKSFEEAFDDIRKNEETQFDTALAEKFIDCMKRISYKKENI